ncbi:MAG: hypothetical protein RIR65_661 [Planctomycetota bacterium]
MARFAGHAAVLRVQGSFTSTSQGAVGRVVLAGRGVAPCEVDVKRIRGPPGRVSGFRTPGGRRLLAIAWSVSPPGVRIPPMAVVWEGQGLEGALRGLGAAVCVDLQGVGCGSRFFALSGFGVLRAAVAWLAFGEHAGRCVVWAFCVLGGVARLWRARWALGGLGVLRAGAAWLAFGEHAGRCVVSAFCVLGRRGSPSASTLGVVWFGRVACLGGVARLWRARWALCGLGVLRAARMGLQSPHAACVTRRGRACLFRGPRRWRFLNFSRTCDGSGVSPSLCVCRWCAGACPCLEQPHVDAS